MLNATVKRGFLISIIFSLSTLNSITASAASKVISNLENAGFEESIYTIDVNKEKKDQAEIILLKNNVPYIPEDELKTWRLKELPTCIVIKYEGETFYSLDCFTGIRYKLEPEKMVLDINLPAKYFKPLDIGRKRAITVLASPPKRPGGFLNYDLDAEHLSYEHNNQVDRYNGLFEGGYFNRFGVGQANVLYRDGDKDFEGHNVARLSTKWTYDDVDDMRRFQLGDTQTNNGVFGRSILFGGLHIAKNYNLQPDTQIYPLPEITGGTAVVPSAVDFYLNNVRVFRKDVPPGPFDINMFPVITGAGTIKVVTRDLFGKEQILTIPYYYSEQLLKKGLHQYKFDAGFARENYGLNSFDYGNFLISATDRYGLTNNITLDGHAATYLNNVYMVDGGFDYLPSPRLGVFSLGIGGSIRKNSKQGALLSAGFKTRRRRWQFGVTSHWTTKYFLDLGYTPNSFLPELQTQVFSSRSVGKSSSIGIGFLNQVNREPTSNSNFLTGSFTTRFLKIWNITLAAQDNLNLKKDRAIMLLISRRLFNNSYLNLNGTYAETGKQGGISLNKNLSDGPGWGYRVSGELRKYQTESRIVTGRLSYQNNIGTYHADLADDNNQASYRLNALGSVLYFDGKPYLSRFNTTSFGVVEVPGYKNVRVYRNNVLLGRTNSNGKVVIPKLQSYYKNTLGIDANDIPLDTQIIGNDHQTIVPYYLSGVKAIFHVRKIHSVEFKLTLPSGKAMPESAIIKQEGTDEEFYVDEDGKVYLELLGTAGKFKVIGSDGECHFGVNIPENAKPIDLIYQLGAIVCRFEPYPTEKKSPAGTARCATTENNV